MSFVPKVIYISSREKLFELAFSFRKSILDNKVLVIKGSDPLSENEFEKLCQIISISPNRPFVSWDFGHILNLKNNKESENYIFSNEKVPLHWDGAFHEVPNILGFQCIQNTVDGGRTVFLDTTKILNDLCVNVKKDLNKEAISYETEKVAHYGGTISQKIIDTHPETGESVIRFSEEVQTSKNPVKRLVPKSILGSVEKLEYFLQMSKYRYLHNWEAGDMLFADNISLLHGREKIVQAPNGKRHLRRLQIR